MRVVGQDFLTIENIGNFTLLLVIVVVATEFTKKLLNESWRIKTERIVFMYSLILSVIRTLLNPNTIWHDPVIAFVNTVLIIVNAILVGYFATSGYSKIIENYIDRHPTRKATNANGESSVKDNEEDVAEGLGG